jgi:hypothetical protein
VHVVGHLVDVDAHGNALGKANPGKHRIYFWQALRVGSGVGVGDAAVDAFDVAKQSVVGVSN